MNSEQNALKSKYSYCDCIEISLSPSTSPALFSRATVRCGLYDFTIFNPEDCANCNFKKAEGVENGR